MQSSTYFIYTNIDILNQYRKAFMAPAMQTQGRQFIDFFEFFIKNLIIKHSNKKLKLPKLALVKVFGITLLEIRDNNIETTSVNWKMLEIIGDIQMTNVFINQDRDLKPVNVGNTNASNNLVNWYEQSKREVQLLSPAEQMKQNPTKEILSMREQIKKLQAEQEVNKARLRAVGLRETDSMYSNTMEHAENIENTIHAAQNATIEQLASALSDDQVFSPAPSSTAASNTAASITATRNRATSSRAASSRETKLSESSSTDSNINETTNEISDTTTNIITDGRTLNNQANPSSRNEAHSNQGSGFKNNDQFKEQEYGNHTFTYDLGPYDSAQMQNKKYVELV